MKRRDEAGRAERGPFSTGLAGQAAMQAGRQAQSVTDYTSAQPDVPFWVKITSGEGGEGLISRSPATIIIAFFCHCLLRSPSFSDFICLTADLKKMLDVKYASSISFRLVFLPLRLHAPLSISLFSRFHFAYSICCLLPWAMIPFTSENSAPFILSLGIRKGKKKKKEKKKRKRNLLLSSYLPSAFFVIISNSQRRREQAIWQCFELFAKHKAKMDVSYLL